MQRSGTIPASRASLPLSGFDDGDRALWLPALVKQTVVVTGSSIRRRKRWQRILGNHVAHVQCQERGCVRGICGLQDPTVPVPGLRSLTAGLVMG